MAGATNYAAEANKHAQRAVILMIGESTNPALEQRELAEAQVHATLAVAYATLAVYTSTGNG